MIKVLVFFVCAIGYAQPSVTVLPQETIEKRLRAFTVKNATREPAIQVLFTEAGCKDISEQKVKGSKAPNLICTLKGTSDSIIVVGAHFDLVEKGQGVVDNWSGASLLPSLYQGLAGAARKHTFVFVAFTGEEEGLYGSKTFVKQMDPGVKAMINMDTLGLGETKIWLSHADSTLATYLSAVAQQLKIPLGVVNMDRLTTDSESFREKNIPAMTVHTLTQETLPLLHSRKDTIEAIHLDAYYQTYRLLMLYLGALDPKLD